jgi:hypothetical protein
MGIIVERALARLGIEPRHSVGECRNRMISPEAQGTILEFKGLMHRVDPIALDTKSPWPQLASQRWGHFFAGCSNWYLAGGVHLRLMDMSTLDASQGPVLKAGTRWDNALDRRAGLASRAAVPRW